MNATPLIRNLVSVKGTRYRNWRIHRQKWRPSHKNTGKLFVCDVNGCDFETSRLNYLMKHVVKHINAPSFVRGATGCDFSQKNQLAVHLTSHLVAPHYRPCIRMHEKGLWFHSRQWSSHQSHMQMYPATTLFACKENHCGDYSTTCSSHFKTTCGCTQVSGLIFARMKVAALHRERTMASEGIYQQLTRLSALSYARSWAVAISSRTWSPQVSYATTFNWLFSFKCKVEACG